MSFQTCKTSPSENKLRYSCCFPRALRASHRQQWNYTINVQKRSKRISKIIHDIRGSTLILRSYENTFCTQRKQKGRLYSTIRLLHVTVAPFWRISTERKQRMLFCVSRTTRIRCFRSNQRVNKRRKHIKNILICVPKMTGGLERLEVQ